MDSQRKNVSLWIATAPAPTFPTLYAGLEVDVAVLGGGIAGLTTAALLKRAGKTVAVVEARALIQGVTGYTTAKVTSNHGLIYAELVRKFGDEGARIYGQSNQAALERIAQFVAEENIDCDFERKPSFSYTESPAELKEIEDEVAAAQHLGLPASFVTESGLPFPIAGAVRFDNQAQFHPRKYLLHLAQQLTGDGSYVFEETRALDVEEGDRCRVLTDKGELRARDVVVATHYPFLNRGLYFARLRPEREYAIAALASPEQDPGGMYITIGNPTRSVRTATSPDGMLLIIGGEEHRPGEEPRTDERYRAVEEFARARFAVDSFPYRWSTQDNFTLDRVPYIGRYMPGSEHLWVATGFGAWGMTNGTLAGMILSDLILGKPNPWADFYNPSRVDPGPAAREFLAGNLTVARHFFGDRLGAGVRSLSEVAPGEGEIVEDVDGVKVAVYKDEQGEAYAYQAECTHLGCLLRWNRAEKSWDCPCHGSRFDAKGKVIHGPAVRDLEEKDLPRE